MDDKKSSGRKHEEGLLNQLLTAENLEYNLPSASTVVVEKNSKIFFFDKQEYKQDSDRMMITLNSGSDFIDGKNSYLKFTLKLTAPGVVGGTDFVGFGQGSAGNVFSEILIRARDGAEIERVRDLNVLMACRTRWSNAENYLDNAATAQGYTSDVSDEARTKVTAGLTVGTGTEYVIPMRELSALFNTDKLLPSFLMSGMKIELVLAPAIAAFYSTGGTARAVTGYTISAPIIRLETLKLSDSIMNQLTQNAANSGLVIPIDTWDLTRDTITDKANLEIRRNVSQVLGVLIKIRESARVSGGTAFQQDSMASEDYRVADYRFRLGSQFIPNSSVASKVEAYSLAQIAFNKYKATAAENSISVYDYYGVDPDLVTPLHKGQAVIASDLERSAMDLSGVSISNSKVLAFEANMVAGGNERTVCAWIQFTRALTVFLTSTLVED